MIDLDRAMLVVYAYPDQRWPLELFEWWEKLHKAHPSIKRASVSKRNIVCARNWGIKTHLKHADYFIFCDHDVRPGKLTDQFLELDADIVACQMDARNKHAWIAPDSFHDSLWATSREVLEAIGAPWFWWDYNSDKTQMAGCLCQSFRNKAKAAGFSIAHGGWAETDMDGSWC